MLLRSLTLDGLLSFPPGSEPIELTPLNVLIGPNASGKSNLIEAVELLRALPTSFAAAIRDGGGVSEWLWKGQHSAADATLETWVRGERELPDLRYRLNFASSGQRTEVLDEAIEAVEGHRPHEKEGFFYYR